MAEGIINADIAAQLLGITPKEVNRLASDGIVPRVGPNQFPLIGLVKAFVNYLRNEITRMSEKPTQLEIARHLCMSDRNVRDLQSRGVLDPNGTLDDNRESYIPWIREQAAGRGGDEQGALTKARTQEALNNALLKELQLHKEAGTLLPLDEVEQLLMNWIASSQSGFCSALENFAQAIESEHGITVPQEQVDTVAAAALRNVSRAPLLTGSQDDAIDECSDDDADAADERQLASTDKPDT